MDKRDFDVVVIGAGSAGCTLVNVLCRSEGLSVCLVEAGPDYGPFDSGRWPEDLLDPRFDPMSHDWDYQADRAEGSGFIDPRAKVVGGCSSHNDCAALWGLPDDYDSWAEAGNPGWGFEDLKPLIQRIEGVSPDSVTPYRGRNGALYTRRRPESELSIYQRFYLDACSEAGFPRVDDMSAPDPEEGVGSYHANVKDSVRWNAAFAFLDPVREHPNLTIMSDTMTDRLIIEGHKATGLICQTSNGALELRAERFILCAGAYGSPSVLMRSGIGPPGHLRELNIPVMIDLQGVGRNLHDHPSFYIQFVPTPDAWRVVTEDLGSPDAYRGQVMLRAKSPFCQGPFDLHIMPAQVNRTLESRTLEFFACNMAPLSRGEVLLRGEDPGLPPRILTRYLTDPEDRDMSVLVYGLELIRRLAGKGPLASALAGESETWNSLRSESQIKDHLRRTVRNYSHAVGTCKMGPSVDPDAVVDSAGRVHGADNLYVADASIIPLIPRVNTNLTAMLIGMKVADQLLAGPV
ncbi:MAG: GMC family oxidoreductase [Chloroflexi bacterium]|nr:GMC family oxidoreductase [Chloroflexota bacterium]